MRERQIRLDRAHSNKKGEQWTLASPPERRGAAPEGAWARAEESARPPRPAQSAPKKTKAAPRAPAVYSAPPQRPSAKKGRRAARGALSFVGMTALFLLLSLGAFTGLRALLGRASGGPAQPAGAGVQEPIVTEAAWDPAGPPYVVAVDPGHGGADRGAEDVYKRQPCACTWPSRPEGWPENRAQRFATRGRSPKTHFFKLKY